MFERMAEDCWRKTTKVHEAHQALKWDGDDELVDVHALYLLTLQALSMEDIDHTLVSLSLTPLMNPLTLSLSKADRPSHLTKHWEGGTRGEVERHLD